MPPTGSETARKCTRPDRNISGGKVIRRITIIIKKQHITTTIIFDRRLKTRLVNGKWVINRMTFLTRQTAGRGGKGFRAVGRKTQTGGRAGGGMTNFGHLNGPRRFFLWVCRKRDADFINYVLRAAAKPYALLSPLHRRRTTNMPNRQRQTWPDINARAGCVYVRTHNPRRVYGAENAIPRAYTNIHL